MISFCKFRNLAPGCDATPSCKKPAAVLPSLMRTQRARQIANPILAAP